MMLADAVGAQAAGLACGPDPAVLTRIARPEISIALWQRRLPESLVAGLPRRMLKKAADIRFDAAIDGLGSTLAEALATAGYPAGPTTDALAQDVGALAARMVELCGTIRLEVRLEVVGTDGCRKFHADYVRSRLLTTYAGPGTQWLDRNDANRFEAGEDPGRGAIRTMATGHVALCKGRLAAGRPLIHRSPPLGASGTLRLVLAIDPLD